MLSKKSLVYILKEIGCKCVNEYMRIATVRKFLESLQISQGLNLKN